MPKADNISKVDMVVYALAVLGGGCINKCVTGYLVI